MSTPPPVTRTILTEADYSTMNWHDNAVHCPRHVLSVEERGAFGFDRFGYTP